MNLSNFATKSRIVVYEKGLNIEIAPIPGAGPSSPEYKRINPLGKIPSLDADGTIIAESEVINEYLEDKYPNPPLLPKTPGDLFQRFSSAARVSAA
jgi:glutathione S-transferase